MFGRKKRPIITATYCTLYENIRLAISVLTGHSTRIVCVDFNTGRGKVRIGSNESFELQLALDHGGDTLSFTFGQGWCSAHFPEIGVVDVGYDFGHPGHPDETPVRWVGRSAYEREKVEQPDDGLNFHDGVEIGPRDQSL